jgi:hypothetical protein
VRFVRPLHWFSVLAVHRIIVTNTPITSDGGDCQFSSIGSRDAQLVEEELS